MTGGHRASDNATPCSAGALAVKSCSAAADAGASRGSRPGASRGLETHHERPQGQVEHPREVFDLLEYAIM